MSSRLARKNSTVFAKMRIYDGDSLKESDPKARSVQAKDAAGVDEGMDGVSTRFAFKVLAATFNHDTNEVGADAVHPCTRWSRRSGASSFLTGREAFLEFIKAELAPAMPEFIGHEIQKAYLNPIRITARTCSIAMSTMPTPGSRIRTSRIPTPDNCSIANCSIRS